MTEHQCRVAAAGVVGRLRKYPFAKVRIGTRATLAMYETMMSLDLVGSENPILTAAMITLPHRLVSDSVIDNERIVREVVAEYLDPDASPSAKAGRSVVPADSVPEVLKELDALRDMIHSMPYEIDLSSESCFRISRDTLFRAEAPRLFALALDSSGRPDYQRYRRALEELKEQGLVRMDHKGMTLTPYGTRVRFKNLFQDIEQRLWRMASRRRMNDSVSTDSRKYQRGDRYRDLHPRRTMRNLLKRGRQVSEAHAGDLRVKDVPYSKQFRLLLAVDHSWSMARSKKLQYAKEAAAGLIYAAASKRDKVALIGFSDNAVTLSPLSQNYVYLLSRIVLLRPKNETNIGDALRKATMVIRRSGAACVNHVIVITDGVPTTLDATRTRKNLADVINAETRKMRKLGITISVICIRDDLEEASFEQAMRIAEVGRGSFSLVRAEDVMNQMLKDYTSLER
jgi:Mg-chelatase subunit ChlD